MELLREYLFCLLLMWLVKCSNAELTLSSLSSESFTSVTNEKQVLQYVCNDVITFMCEIEPYTGTATFQINGNIEVDCGLFSCDNYLQSSGTASLSHYFNSSHVVLNVTVNPILFTDNGTVFLCEDGAVLKSVEAIVKVSPSVRTIDESVANQLSTTTGCIYPYTADELQITWSIFKDGMQPITLAGNVSRYVVNSSLCDAGQVCGGNGTANIKNTIYFEETGNDMFYLQVNISHIKSPSIPTLINTTKQYRILLPSTPEVNKKVKSDSDLSTWEIVGISFAVLAVVIIILCCCCLYFGCCCCCCCCKEKHKQQQSSVDRKRQLTIAGKQTHEAKGAGATGRYEQLLFGRELPDGRSKKGLEKIEAPFIRTEISNKQNKTGGTRHNQRVLEVPEEGLDDGNKPKQSMDVTAAQKGPNNAKTKDNHAVKSEGMQEQRNKKNKVEDVRNDQVSAGVHKEGINDRNKSRQGTNAVAAQERSGKVKTTNSPTDKRDGSKELPNKQNKTGGTRHNQRASEVPEEGIDDGNKPKQSVDKTAAQGGSDNAKAKDNHADKSEDMKEQRNKHNKVENVRHAQGAARVHKEGISDRIKPRQDTDVIATHERSGNVKPKTNPSNKSDGSEELPNKQNKTGGTKHNQRASEVPEEGIDDGNKPKQSVDKTAAQRGSDNAKTKDNHADKSEDMKELPNKQNKTGGTRHNQRASEVPEEGIDDGNKPKLSGDVTAAQEGSDNAKTKDNHTDESEDNNEKCLDEQTSAVKNRTDTINLDTVSYADRGSHDIHKDVEGTGASTVQKPSANNTKE